MTWTIARVQDDKYELRDPNGTAVESYHQAAMDHPSGWIQDAVENGAEGWAISSGGWKYSDER